MWPLLQRELRAEAHRPLSRWLRVGTAAIFFVILDLALNTIQQPERVARQLFPWLHTGLLLIPWIVAPLLTSELLATEKQEGTLAVLLLTPLSLQSVLRAKTLALTLRILTIVLAALPVLVFTVFFGGVGGVELRLALFLHGASLILSLSLSMLSAAWASTWLRATALGLTVNVFASVLSAALLYLAFQGVIGHYFAQQLWPQPHGLRDLLAGTGQLITDAGGIWGRTEAVIPTVLVSGWLWIFGSALLVAMVLSVLCGVGSRWAVVYDLQGGGGTRIPLLRGRWFAVSAKIRRRWLRRRPLRWLMRYPVEVRVGRWLAALLMLAIQGWILWRRPEREPWFLMQFGLGISISLALALIAAASYRRERFEGGFELLLTTPLKPAELAQARLAGLAWQFAPVWGVWVVGVLGVWPPFLAPSLPLSLVLLGTLICVGTAAIGLEAAFHFHGYWAAAASTAVLAPGLGFFFEIPGLVDSSGITGSWLGGLIVGINTILVWPDLPRHLHERWVRETLLQGRRRLGIIGLGVRPQHQLKVWLQKPASTQAYEPTETKASHSARRRLRSSRPPRARR